MVFHLRLEAKSKKHESVEITSSVVVVVVVGGFQPHKAHMSIINLIIYTTTKTNKERDKAR